MIQPVSHRDLAFIPEDKANHVKRGPTFKYTSAQKRELDRIRKNTYGKERSTAIAAISKEWGVPAQSIYYQLRKTGRKTDKKPAKKKLSLPAKKSTALDIPTKGTETKLRFRITSLEIKDGEIIMSLRT